MASSVVKRSALLSEYADTYVVRRNRGAIPISAEAGKEFFFAPSDILTQGSFRLALHGKDLVAWTSSTDIVEPKQQLKNFMDFGFSVLPDTAYRCWVYAGACCEETLAFTLQGTELTGPDPKLPTILVKAEIDGEVRVSIKHGVRNLKKVHAKHGGPKQPSRWYWIEIPLPIQLGSPE